MYIVLRSAVTGFVECEGHMLNLWVRTSRVGNRSLCRGGRQRGEVTFGVLRSVGLQPWFTH